MPHSVPAFNPSLPLSHSLQPRFSPRTAPHTPLKRHRPSSSMHFFDPVHTLPEFFNHLVVSCGLGFAGIAGAKATERARALKAGDSQADRMEAVALQIDSVRRRAELARVRRVREWDDVAVDRFGGVRVWIEDVPEIGGVDEMKEFDRLLREGGEHRRE